MSTEFNELLSHPYGDRAQIWIVGTREQVNHIINEMYVKEMTADRSLRWTRKTGQMAKVVTKILIAQM